MRGLFMVVFVLTFAFFASPSGATTSQFCDELMEIYDTHAGSDVTTFGSKLLAISYRAQKDGNLDTEIKSNMLKYVILILKEKKETEAAEVFNGVIVRCFELASQQSPRK